MKVMAPVFESMLKSAASAPPFLAKVSASPSVSLAVTVPTAFVFSLRPKAVPEVNFGATLLEAASTLRLTAAEAVPPLPSEML